MIIEKTKLTMYLVLAAGMILLLWGIVQLGFSNIVVTGYFQPGSEQYGIMLMGLGLGGLTSLLTGIFLIFLSRDIGRASMIARKCGIVMSVILFVFSAWVLATGPLFIPVIGIDPVIKTICGLLVLAPLIVYRYYFNW
ncbi:MAG: hypothetical protein GTN38_00605 [Candidatus Aenigmarchaeota archaeon]|nr:hypothetical protein [Candidatus Aenigmarchaeota archaeon]NIP40085.1 hypothetical protein [Candidatus Aenigmarchaeota archaeon]NIQ18162.1 hypothetical protein [Candidatus Aenigmarchaeota archaeon]NIS72919.1 hypothetical protein [Candidatus Aenigmarchaeota archaeon]